jgi:Domain of unknown function (DUF3846)
MAILIKPDGSKRMVFAEGDFFTLKEMYSVLDCSIIQPIFLEDGRIMWIDEEGKLKPHNVNLSATGLLHKAGGLLSDYIAGLALITDKDEVE